jgi:hypothetical protein
VRFIPSEAEKLWLQEALLLLGGQGVADDEFLRLWLRKPPADRIRLRVQALSHLLLLLLSDFAVQPHAHRKQNKTKQNPKAPNLTGHRSNRELGIRFPFSALSRSVPVRFVQ